MTVIAAMKHNNCIYMGCDSLFMSSEDYKPVKRVQSKITIKGELVIGITTSHSCRVFQEIKYKLKLPPTKGIESNDLLEYLVSHFCPKVFKLLTSLRMLEDDPDRKTSEPSLSPATFLIAIRDRLFEISEDFDVSEINAPFYAIGSGGDYTTGSLEATIEFIPKQIDPEHHLLFAMKTAEKFTQAVKGPFQIINTGDLCLLELS